LVCCGSEQLQVTVNVQMLEVTASCTQTTTVSHKQENA
jgi:hypothetical protein